MHKSDLVLVYESTGNGLFGDYKTFAYAIGDNYCKRIDLGIGSDGKYLSNFLPKNAKIINSSSEISDYEVEATDFYFRVQKGDKTICEFSNTYSSVYLKKGYYIAK